MIPIGRRGSRIFYLEEGDLGPHILIVGGTGCGKSTLAAKILRSLRSRKVVIDPHGDLCWRSGLPVYFPGEIYLNPLEGDFDLILEDMIYSLKNSFGREFWGPRTEHLLTSLLSSLRGLNANFSDLYFLLSNKELFEEFMRHTSGIRISSIREEYLMPLLNKISPFILRAPLRTFLCRRRSKIPSGSFAFNADVGIYGRENSKIICSFFFSHLVQRGFRKREKIWVFCDEFHMYYCPSFLDVLSEGRKFGISLGMISSNIPKELEELVLGNVSALMAFRSPKEIAWKIARYYDIKAEEICSLKPREFLLFLGGEKTKLKTLYVGKGENRRPRPQELKMEDVVPISVLSKVSRPEIWKKILGIGGKRSFLDYLLKTFP